MNTQFGAVKICSAKEVQKRPSICGVDGALELLRRSGAALSGDRSCSADWPGITKCIRRSMTIAFDAHATGFEASISFDAGGETQKHGYFLKRGAAQKIETGWVEHVETLSDAAIREPDWMHSPAYALAAYRYKFVVSTCAEDRPRTARLWLIGINEFSNIESSP